MILLVGRSTQLKLDIRFIFPSILFTDNQMFQSIMMFQIYADISNVFIKFHYYLLRMKKIVEIGWIFHSEKRQSKT